MCLLGAVCVCAYVQRWETDVGDLLINIHLEFLRQGLLLSWKLADSRRLANHWASELCSASSRVCSRLKPPCLALYVSSGVPNIGSSRLREAGTYWRSCRFQSRGGLEGQGKWRTEDIFLREFSFACLSNFHFSLAIQTDPEKSGKWKHLGSQDLSRLYITVAVLKRQRKRAPRVGVWPRVLK